MKNIKYRIIKDNKIVGFEHVEDDREIGTVVNEQSIYEGDIVEYSKLRSFMKCKQPLLGVVRHDGIKLHIEEIRCGLFELKNTGEIGEFNFYHSPASGISHRYFEWEHLKVIDNIHTETGKQIVERMYK
jgi:hypothetical protein